MEAQQNNKILSKKNVQLNPVWKQLPEDYIIEDLIGEGSFGQVIRAKHAPTGKRVAVKLVQNIFDDEYNARKILREVQLLRNLTHMKNNVFTTKLYDVIVPHPERQTKDNDIQNDVHSPNRNKPSTQQNFRAPQLTTSSSNSKLTYSDPSSSNSATSKDDQENNKERPKIDFLFMVLELVDSDLKKIFSSVPNGTVLQEDHILTIMYNTLCSLNYLHSANVIHRDMKPANLLVDSNCSVKICDFGLARTLPGHQNDVDCLRVKNLLERLQCLNHRLDHDSIDRINEQEKYRKRMARTIEKENVKYNKRQRCLSNRIVSRWYRSPEVILTEKNYDQSLDIWSIGCILAELIHCSEPYVQPAENATPSSHKKYLKNHVANRFVFPGSSCFPLSPCEDMKKNNDSSNVNIVSNNDQLIKINKVLGKLSQEDTCYITDESAQKYEQSLMSKETKQDAFKQMYPHTSPELIQLLKSMLEFNPYFRPTAAECLQNKLFDQIRVPLLERPAPFQIELEYDSEQSGVQFNYEECKTLSMTAKDSRNYFQNLMLQEIQLIKKLNSANLI